MKIKTFSLHKKRKFKRLLGVIIIVSVFLLIFSFLSSLNLKQKTIHSRLTTDVTGVNRELFDFSFVKKSIQPFDFKGTSTLLSKPSLRSKENKKIINFRKTFFEWQDSKLKSQFTEDYVINASKYFIYRCDMGAMKFCGGWGDRIKGIIVAYLIANLTGRVFKIELTNPPCDISELLVPNLVNWTLPTSIHKMVTQNTTGALKRNMIGNFTFIQQIHKMNFTEWINSEVDYVYFKTNALSINEFRKSLVYGHQLSWMKERSNSEIYSAIFKRLFKLSPKLNSKMKIFLEAMVPTSKHELVCAHIRVGKNPSIPLDLKVKMLPEHFPKIWKFLANHSSNNLQSVFIMSDSEDVIKEARKQVFGSRIFMTSGAIVHVDKFTTENNEEMCSGLEKVIFDQHVLMTCDVLMISKSGLSKSAASLRGENQGLYMLTPAGKIVPQRLNDFFGTIKH